MKYIILSLSLLFIPSMAYADDHTDAIVAMVQSGANPVAARCAVDGDGLRYDACEDAAKVPNNYPALQQEIMILNQKIDVLTSIIQNNQNRN